jgi:DNA-binding CsgD family transcriptional regulator
MRLINRQLSHEDDWEVFEQNFNKVHEAFFQKLIARFPNLTPGDLKLAACLKMNLTSKEIAPLLNISLRGVENKRYRLRKKLDLPNDENLTEFMLNL